MKKIILSASLFLAFCLTTKAQYTKIFDFSGKDGMHPAADLIMEGAYLYGMTPSGDTNNLGNIFKIKPDGTGYSRLLLFAGATNGGNPNGSLFSDGSFLYGMTNLGGKNNFGTIFKIKFDGTGYSNLYDFAGNTDGSYPIGSLISDGTFLYGMTSKGGTKNYGTIFKIKTDGTGYIKLFDFDHVSTGDSPRGSLLSEGGFLYGMTYMGGSNLGATSFGTIFKIKTDGTGFSRILNLADSANAGMGRNPYGNLISDGTFLYGLASGGGTKTNGTLFKIKPDGTGYSKLYNFTKNNTSGDDPRGSLLYDGTFLYGTTNMGGADDIGTLFKIKTDGTGYTNLHNFKAGTEGRNPCGSVISDGSSLYGFTSGGGANFGAGTIFKYAITTGITKVNEETNIYIYPNPTNSSFKVISSSIIYKIDIYNIAGVLVMQGLSNGDIDVSLLNSGMYFARVYTGKSISVLKFVRE